MDKQSRKRKAPRSTAAADEEEERLQQLLFGGKPLIVNKSTPTASEGEDDSIASFVRAGAPEASDDDDEGDLGNESKIARALKKGGNPRPAWEDDDEEELEVDIATKNQLRKLRTSEEESVVSGTEYAKRLRNQFTKLNPNQAWATLPSAKPHKPSRREKGEDASDDSDADEERDQEDELVLNQTESLIKTDSETLLSDRISLTRVRDANRQEPSGAVIQALEFHPNSQLLLTGGYDKRLRLFQIDGTKNAKVQSVFFGDLPIHTARFFNGGNEVILSGRRPFFYQYDIAAGKVMKVPRILGREEKSLENFVVAPDGSLIAFIGDGGCILLVSGKSKQAIGTMKINGTLRALAFTSDSKYLYAGGGDGEIYKWDVGTRRCVLRYTDEGATTTSSIGTDLLGKYYAVGSESGVVNIYDGTKSQRQAPLKAVMNLTTGVDDMVFNFDSQLLAISSHRKKDALKLVHLPTCTVFANWPTMRTPLHYVTALAFSPHSGYLAIGNDRGKALLYRVNHYKNV